MTTRFVSIANKIYTLCYLTMAIFALVVVTAFLVSTATQDNQKTNTVMYFSMIPAGLLIIELGILVVISYLNSRVRAK